MSTLSQIAAYSQTAIAAYAESLHPLGNNASVYQDPDLGMSPTQAAAFDANWAVLDQFDPNTPGAMGFSDVLLKRKDLDGNATGEKLLAIAGTDPSSGKDLLTDYVSVFKLGTMTGMEQYVTLENYYDGLKAAGLIGLGEQVVFSMTGVFWVAFQW